MLPDNKQFLQAIFGADAPFAHITDFPYDPSNIPNDRHMSAWSGDWASRYQLQAGTNQYFCISIFNPDTGDQIKQARRRKALFLRTPVIVLDDVREKLDIEQASRLPTPSWILETSPGSEQWGYVLDVPCHDRNRVENLLDGLVANGLAPDGKDPGMKGVTRYVRLPDGYNTKQSKLVNGLPFKCRMLLWQPFNRVTMEQLAQPFAINLDAARRESRVDGAASLPDHPLLQIPDVIHVKEIRSDGRYDITCPWVHEHTDQADNGTAIFTNHDGSIGFKCQHGSHENITGKHLLRYIEEQRPGFCEQLAGWQAIRSFAEIQQSATLPQCPAVEEEPQLPAPASIPSSATGVDVLLDALRSQGTPHREKKALAQELVKAAESMTKLDQLDIHNDIAQIFGLNKTQLEEFVRDVRKSMYDRGPADLSFLSEVVYVGEQDKFYSFKTRIWYTATAFSNAFLHDDSEVKLKALQGAVSKVDKIDFLPGEGRFYQRGGVSFANTWDPTLVRRGVPGDCSPWLKHFDVIGWAEYKGHILDWLAYTLQHPENKINHALILGGREGCGKDFLIYPLIIAMAEYAKVIHGNELLADFDEYLLNCKFLLVNETELGDHKAASQISSKLKPLAAAPPATLRVNPKNVTRLDITNILSVVMTTNSQTPLRLDGISRRFYAVWSDLNLRDPATLDVLPDWKEYWRGMWGWMVGGGVHYCIDFLMRRDVSHFNPGEAPVVTEFMREIQEVSKSPAVNTIEGLVRIGKGCFVSDLVTVPDIVETIRSYAGVPNSPVVMNMQHVNIRSVSNAMGQIEHFYKAYAQKWGEGSARVWVVRNAEKYRGMSQSDLYDQYQSQINGMVLPGGSNVVQMRS